MRGAIPIILVLLAVFTAVCIAYIAWELSSGSASSKKPVAPDPDDEPESGET